MSHRILAFLVATATICGGLAWLTTHDSYVGYDDLQEVKSIVRRGAAGESTTAAERAKAIYVGHTHGVIKDAEQSVAMMYVAESPGSYTEVRAFPENIMCYQAHVIPEPVPSNVFRHWTNKPKTVRRAGIHLNDFDVERRTAALTD